jgi:hypothetical protein
MRTLVVVPLLSAGCLSQAAFEEKYAAKLCEEFESCVTSAEATCDELTTTTAEPVECEFDRSAARDCLKGVWTCDSQFEGYEFPIPPAACASVCGAAETPVTGTDAAM